MGLVITACFTSITCGPAIPGRTFSRLGLQPRLRRTQEAFGSQVGWLKLIDGWSWRRVTWLRIWWFKCCVDFFFCFRQLLAAGWFHVHPYQEKFCWVRPTSGKSQETCWISWGVHAVSVSFIKRAKRYSSRRDEDDKRRMLLDAFNADLDQVTVFSQLAGSSFSSQVSMEMSLMMELTDNTHQYIVVHQASLRNRVSPKAKKTEW